MSINKMPITFLLPDIEIDFHSFLFFLMTFYVCGVWYGYHGSGHFTHFCNSDNFLMLCLVPTQVWVVEIKDAMPERSGTKGPVRRPIKKLSKMFT